MFIIICSELTLDEIKITGIFFCSKKIAFCVNNANSFLATKIFKPNITNFFFQGLLHVGDQGPETVRVADGHHQGGGGTGPGQFGGHPHIHHPNIPEIRPQDHHAGLY